MKNKTSKKTKPCISKKTKSANQNSKKLKRKKFRQHLQKMTRTDEDEKELDDFNVNACQNEKSEGDVKTSKTQSKVTQTNKKEQSKFSAADLDDQNIGKFFAIYWSKPRVYHWEKLTKVFSSNGDNEKDKVQIMYLKKVGNSTDPSHIKWDLPIKEDKGIVDTRLCSAGQCLLDVKHASCTKSALTFESEAKVLKKNASANIKCICK